MRLYRENSPKKTTKKDWECVCFTLTDWQTFIKQFRKTTNSQERELYTYLNYHLLPIIECQLQELNNKRKEIILFNNSILKREKEELEEMLEKINCINSNNNNTTSVVDTNNTDILCCENNRNGSNNNNNNEKSNQEFVAKSEDQKLNVNCCVVESTEKTQSNKNTGSAMLDIKPNAMSNMCTNPCASNCVNNCGNSHDRCNCGSLNCSHISTDNPPNRENSQDGAIPLNDNPSDNSLNSNKENAPPSVGSSGLGELPPVSAMSNMVGSTGPSGSSSSVQPLPSNMLNKSTVPMETQYMQQQSQIFVFSTSLANRASDSVLTGQFPSIIAFHCSQPGTKRFLEKHPLKIQQFNRQNPAQWLNNLAQMKQNNRQMKSGNINQFGGPAILTHPFPGPSASGPCPGPCTIHGMGSCPGSNQSMNWPSMNALGPSESCNPQQWLQQYPQGNMMNNHPRFHNALGVSPGENAPMRAIGPHTHPNAMGCMPSLGSNQGNHSFPSGNHYQASLGNPALMSTGGSLTGVKIPDENLTPQQRQHREEQLAMIRKMQQLLFPDQHHEQQQSPSNITSMHNMLNQSAQSRFQGNEMCPQSGIDISYPHHACLNEQEHRHLCADNGMFPSPGLISSSQHQNMPPSSVSAQLEWQKLQHQFYEERRKKHLNTQNPVIPVSGSPSQPTVNSPSPSIGMSPRLPGPPPPPPPPPYHQTPCSTLSSPHPASPNPSSLSLSSPRMASGLPSPAETSRQFSHPTPPGPRMSQSSPGNSAGCSSIQTTPLNSPKPAATSSGPPSTGNSAMVRTPTTPSNPNTTPTSTPSSILPSPSPGTPVGSCGVGNRKQSVTLADGQDSSNDFTPISQPSSTSSSNTGDGMFGRHVPCNQTSNSQKPLSDCSNTQGNLSHKEPSLMPVPSPQQIQYLNAFDGQELTIQKQPNTSLRDLDLVSPNVITNNTIDMSPSSHPQPFPTPDSSQGSFSNFNGPFSSSMDTTQENLPTHFNSAGQGTIEGPRRFSLPSPQMNAGIENGHRLIGSNSQSQQIEGPVQRFAGSQSQNFNGLPRMLGSNQMHPSMIDGPSQRFVSPAHHGPRCGPLQLSASTMDNPMRFPGNTPSMEPIQRFRGPSPHGSNLEMINPRIPTPHIGGNNSIPTHQQFGTVIPCGEPGHGIPCGPGQPMIPSGACFGPESGHSHLQSLQKMAPPFDITPTNKMSADVIGPGPGGNGQPYNSGNITSGLHQQTNNSQRLTHFDPIASMAAMSENSGPLTSSASNAHPSQGMMTTSMNLSNMQVTNATANNQPNMVNFHTNMQSMQGMHQQEGQPSYNIANQMAHNMGTGPQTVNNTYVNATMSIQQLNIQNVTTSAYNPNIHIPPMNPSPGMLSQQINPGSGTQTISSSVTTNHPIMHSTVSPKSASVNMAMASLHGNSHVQPFPSQSVAGQRTMNPGVASMSPVMMTRAPGAVTPFNSTNIHVKANAPNTIQYLPARPQSTAPPPTRPPSLDFLQRFATPLTNLDNKVPTHNLQYFPNGSNNTQTVNNMAASLPPTPPSGMVPGQSIIGGQRSINMAVGAMGMRSPAPGPIPQGVNQMYPSILKIGGRESPIFGRHAGQSSGLPGNIIGIGTQGPGMYANKQLSPAGMPPEASQPLPPSMGHSFNYKQSPFCGPTTADPNYAVQFHNFQQQLYATNTRGSSQSSMSTGQNFFGPK